MRGLAQGSINELFRLQLVTVTKLFFIMGLPWTFDVISTAVNRTHDDVQWKYNIRIALDILNLLTVITDSFHVENLHKIAILGSFNLYYTRLQESGL